MPTSRAPGLLPSLVLPILGLLALLACPGPAWTRDEAEAENDPPAEPRVVCPALFGDGPEINGMIGGPSRTDLMVAGEVTKDGEERARIRIAQTFYGRAPADEVVFLYGGVSRIREGTQVLVLEARRRGDVAWVLVTSAPATPANLLAAEAVGRARLEDHALSASLVLVGRETAFAKTWDLRRYLGEDNEVRRVTIDRVIVGPDDLAGRDVRIRSRDLSSWAGDDVPLREAPRVFFLVTRSPSDPAPRIESEEEPPCYVADASVPAAVLPDVVAALDRRDAFPIVEPPSVRAGTAERVREIVFLGSVEDAILMHESDPRHWWHLASRGLVLRPEASRELVVSAVLARMFDHTVGAWDRHRTLQRLIRTLGAIEKATPTGVLDRLVLEYVRRLRSAHSRPEAPTAYEPAPGSEAHRTDVNRALVWLLLEIGTDEAQRHAERLRTERDFHGLHYPTWHRELQVALDLLAVEDTESLLAALERGRSLTAPVRRQVALRGDSGVLAFAHHASLLAVRGPAGVVRLRDPLTWAGRDVVTLRHIEGLAFSMDDAHLYVAGGDEGGGLQRHVVATGERDLVYEGHPKSIDDLALSPDGDVLATFSDAGSLLLFHDAASGEILERVEVEGYAMRRGPVGRGVFVRSLEHDCSTAGRYFPFPGRDAPPDVPQRLFPGGRRPMAWAESRDGRWLCCANDHWVPREHDQAGKLVLYERLPEGGYREAARALALDRHAYGTVTISPDGRYVATAGRHRIVHLYTTPDLEPAVQLRFHRAWASEWTTGTVAFSADTSVLAVGLAWSPTPGLVRLDRMEALRPWTGHGDRVEEVWYAAEGTELVTRGRDEALCRWDAETLDPLGRHALPDCFDADHVHPDGDRIFCFEDSIWNDPWPSWDEGRDACVLEVATGAVSSRFTLSPALARCGLWWLADPGRLLLGVKDELLRLDAADGRILHRVRHEADDRGGWLEEDGRHLFRCDSCAKNSRWIEAWRIDVETGETREILPKVKRSVYAVKAGLVPGGRFFYYAAPGLRLFERDTCEEVFHLPLVGVNIEDVAPSPDGRFLALVTRAPFSLAVREAVGGKAASILRILDATDGRTLLAWPLASSGWQLRYAPDGRRLTLRTTGETLIVWTLPDASAMLSRPNDDG